MQSFLQLYLLKPEPELSTLRLRQWTAVAASLMTPDLIIFSNN
jgi:hypothetical protein